MSSMDSLSTSTSLLDLVRNGEQLAWFRLVQVYSPLIELWCRKYEIFGTDADDVIQDTFIAVSKHIRRFGIDHSSNSFRGWLRTIARSKIVDHLRQQKKHRHVDCAESLFFVDEHILCSQEMENDSDMAGSADELKVLMASILSVVKQDFSPQTWQAFWQTVAMGRRTGEVASELGMTPASICMCRARVMRRIRETMAGK